MGFLVIIVDIGDERKLEGREFTKNVSKNSSCVCLRMSEKRKQVDKTSCRCDICMKRLKDIGAEGGKLTRLFQIRFLLMLFLDFEKN